MRAGEDAGDGFVSRWARRKAQARSGAAVAPAPIAAALTPLDASNGVVEAAPSPIGTVPAAEPPPTLADVALLTRDSDYARFVGAGVDNGVTQAAMKKLFSDPHFNVMDGLDTYIDDYGKPDPIPLTMLRRMNQSTVLRLFDDDEDDAEQAEAKQTTEATPESPSHPDDHADLRLQQDDAAGQPGPDQGPGA